MGRVLSVRLSASTYNEEDVFRSWPGLCALAWPGKGVVDGGVWKPNPEVFAPPVDAVPQRHGVNELVHALSDEFLFADWRDDIREKMREGMENLRRAAENLESALADWKPREANAATDAIEDALDNLEKKLA